MPGQISQKAADWDGVPHYKMIQLPSLSLRQIYRAVCFQLKRKQKGRKIPLPTVEYNPANKNTSVENRNKAPTSWENTDFIQESKQVTLGSTVSTGSGSLAGLKTHKQQEAADKS